MPKTYGTLQTDVAVVQALRAELERRAAQSSDPAPYAPPRSVYGTLAREVQANQAKHTAQPKLRPTVFFKKDLRT